MTDAYDDSAADNDLTDSDFGLWDAIPLDDVEPSAPTPVLIAPPAARLRVNAVGESPDHMSLSVEQSDVG